LRCIVDDERFTIEPLEGEHAGHAHSWFDDDGFALLSRWWTQSSWQRKYSYQFNWLGRPIIQLPADVIMMQEIIWRTRPNVIVETGIAHGGSVVLHASLLQMAQSTSTSTNRPHVVAIDIDIRPHNRAALESHPLRPMFTLIEGSSVEPSITRRVRDTLGPDDRVMVVLDSNHTRAHVAAELAAYSPLVSPGCALVVMDSIMPQLARLPGAGRDWDRDHPGTAVESFLTSPPGAHFCVDHSFDGYLLTHSPGGVLLHTDRTAPA
jgi:cephalosporin hydroxylase